MQELRWIDHIGSIENGVQLVNRFLWNITVGQRDQLWLVAAGDSVIFVADNRPAVDAFLYGMALAYSVLPDHLIDTFRQEMREELGEDFAEFEE
jgi:hypothetical protein